MEGGSPAEKFQTQKTRSPSTAINPILTSSADLQMKNASASDSAASSVSSTPQGTSLSNTADASHSVDATDHLLQLTALQPTGDAAIASNDSSSKQQSPAKPTVPMRSEPEATLIQRTDEAGVNIVNNVGESLEWFNLKVRFFF
jgi:hypothetical protein